MLSRMIGCFSSQSVSPVVEMCIRDSLCTGEGGFIAPLAFPKDA